ncbi:MAG TPA: zinc-binding alcohol dehydrogenase family protein [Candidatus Acidoferrales bacterium]|nr:zinc-binding alcohol dehydrogenase family protein [Candidatus Acidoferrales bacterium]
MNAAVVNSFDAPPRYGTFADPAAAEGEVIVNVAAAGLHQIVKSLARGEHYGSTGALPFVPGVDGVGRLEDGTRVFFGFSRSPFGTFAERCVTKRSTCFPLPSTLDDATVAAVMNPAMSSWAALTARIQFTAGESILILGATGVAGHLAVQVSKRLGAKRIVVAGRNSRALEGLQHQGADAAISLEQNGEDLVSSFRKEFAENQIDVILDYLWGHPAEALLAAISQKGLQHGSTRIRYLQVGNSAAPAISLSAATLRSSGLELYGSGFGSVPMKKIFEALAAFLGEAGKQPFQIKTKSVPLRDVETFWSVNEPATRLVFCP